MKFKTTQKAVKAGYSTIICVSYCSLQYLLNYESPVAYTQRREGWAADISERGIPGYNGNPAAHIVNISRTYEQVKAVEEQAEKIRYDYSLSYEQQRESLKSLARDFIKGVCNHE